jgi:transcriptional regulator with XRE-family HTH domain
MAGRTASAAKRRRGPAAPTPEQLGAVIRSARVERELTVEKLATAAGIHWTYLSGIERGVRNPSWKVLTAIAGSLEVPISEIARRAEDLERS